MNRFARELPKHAPLARTEKSISGRKYQPTPVPSVYFKKPTDCFILSCELDIIDFFENKRA